MTCNDGSKYISEIIAMEEYIENNNITEFADFVHEIRNSHPAWHSLLFRNDNINFHFNAFIDSFRRIQEQAYKDFEENKSEENKSEEDESEEDEFPDLPF